MNKKQQSLAFGITDIGRVREDNEDYFYLDEELGLFIVADGMGGHNAGEIASKTTVEYLQQHLNKEVLKTETADIEKILTSAVVSAHQKIVQMAEENPEYRGMGCTVAIAYYDKPYLHTCHVGDARVYVLHDEQLTQKGTDHSVVAESVEAGLMTPEEAKTSEMKNQLTMAIGGPSEITPAYMNQKVWKGDRVILCSDGLWDMVGEETMRQMVGQGTDAENISQSLLGQANEAGGMDNITVITYIID